MKKKFGVQNNFGSYKIWVKKECWVQKILRPNRFKSQKKKLWVKLSETNLGLKEILGPNNFESQKSFGSK